MGLRLMLPSTWSLWHNDDAQPASSAMLPEETPSPRTISLPLSVGLAERRITEIERNPLCGG
jgi:hypothetical protein